MGVGGGDRRHGGEAKGEGAGPAEEVGDGAGAAGGFDENVGHGGLGPGHGLQERAGRQGDARRPQPHPRRTGLEHHLPGHRHPREVRLGGDPPGDGEGVGGGTRPLDPGDVDVQARIRFGHMQGRGGLGAGEEGARETGQGRQRLDQSPPGDDAGLDRLQAPGPPGLEAEPDGAAVAPRVQSEPPSLARAGGEGQADLGVEADALQGLADPLDLPGEVGGVVPLLQRAAAAGAEVRARRDGALGAGDQHLDQLGPVGRHGTRAYPLAGQGQGDHHPVLRDAVAQGAHGHDRHRQRRGRRGQARYRRPCRADQAAVHAGAWSSTNSLRSSALRILPLALRGRVSGQNRIRTGTLKAASRSATKARSSASLA